MSNAREPAKLSDDRVAAQLKDPYFRAWMDAHIADLRKDVFENGLLRTSLMIGFVAGLALHIGGYALKGSAKGEPLGLVADLVYQLGFALWTGVVVVVFVQVIPEIKRRQIKRLVDAYDAAERARSSGAD